MELQFGDVDYARVLYYPRLLHYCHVAMEGFFGEVTGNSYAHLLGERKIGFPTVHLDVTYKSPLRYGTTVRMQVCVLRVGRSSLDLRYRELGDGESGSRAEVLATVVCVNMDTFRSVPIPDDVRPVLEEFLEILPHAEA